MDDIKDHIKKRAALSDYLEHIYLRNAMDEFIKSKSKNCAFPVNMENLEKYYQYSENFTRTWLNYMDNEEFDQVVKKKTGTNNPENIGRASKRSRV